MGGRNVTATPFFVLLVLDAGGTPNWSGHGEKHRKTPRPIKPSGRFTVVQLILSRKINTLNKQPIKPEIRGRKTVVAFIFACNEVITSSIKNACTRGLKNVAVFVTRY